MIKFKVEAFNLEHIFDCGQCFRWEPQEDGSYTGIAGKTIANIAYQEGEVIIDGGGSEAFWKNYLDLERNYGEIKKELICKDPSIKEAIDYGYGIRILNQDRWEALISFIISANNNIPRIKKNIESLAQGFGTLAGEFRGKEYYALPEPEQLAALTPEDLSACKLGYRANYLIKTAAMVKEEGKVCQERLKDYCGVGPKVANCISLFSMGRIESFPIDTWVEKVMRERYGIEDKKEMAKFAKTTFGPYGGIAQQYLFYYMRNKMSGA